MSEINQFHQLVTLVRGMRKPVEMSDDSLIALDDEITALIKEMKGELDKLTQELHDSKYVAVRRLKSLNAWKETAKEFRHQFFIEECAHDELLDELAKELGDD